MLAIKCPALEGTQPFSPQVTGQSLSRLVSGEPGSTELPCTPLVFTSHVSSPAFSTAQAVSCSRNISIHLQPTVFTAVLVVPECPLR
jgi:hypothetical protein